MFAKLRYEANFYASIYVVLAVCLFLAYCGQGIGFAYCSEQLLHRVRSQAFRAMLSQDLSFFDKEENTAGALTAFLSTETAHVALMSGVTLGKILIITTTLVAAVSKRNFQSALKSSILYAASQSFVTLCMGLGFWYGGTLLAEGEYTNRDFFICFLAIMFGAQAAGAMFSFAPDMGETLEAQGGIDFRDVHFAYPSKLEQPILHGLSFTVSPGQCIALVGTSGCGKTTVISLLERFYDPTRGVYRKYLALVSQEPTLYQGTIQENLLLGTAREDVKEKEIVLACKEANIYDFVMTLPDGFSTVVGSRGTMLSGGQKQRIAIARALLRNPKILLLDEATSALDSESEHQVQTVLDSVSKSRTTIVIAHRLSTIQNADMILVLDAGRIIESRTHSSLLRKRGSYFDFVGLQKLEKNEQAGVGGF
ncbi:P-loop containing nucleoside triphosphate hydrolase protein [Stipitochalara longipes BDJ]|nr:P-loop containing nucleoside triphosphate hydrolase protein [Stipitochalara longipes BDJ]